MRLNGLPCRLPAPSALNPPSFTVLRSSQQHLHLSDTAPRLACFGITTEILRLPSGFQCHGLVGVRLSLVMFFVCLFLSSSVRMNQGRPAPLRPRSLRLASACVFYTMSSERGCPLFLPLTLLNSC